MSKSFDRLKNALKRLPGTGVKSAERMALHLALENRADAIEIAESITAALERITPCPECFGLSETGSPAKYAPTPPEFPTVFALSKKPQTFPL